MEKTLPLLLPLILIWKKHCHCYWHWYCDMEKIAIDIAIDIVTGKILLLILSLVLLIPQPLLLLLPLEIWRPDNCYCYCSKNFAIAHVCYTNGPKLRQGFFCPIFRQRKTRLCPRFWVRPFSEPVRWEKIWVRQFLPDFSAVFLTKLWQFCSRIWVRVKFWLELGEKIELDLKIDLS